MFVVNRSRASWPLPGQHPESCRRHVRQRMAACIRNFRNGKISRRRGARYRKILQHPVEQCGEIGVRQRRGGNTRYPYQVISALGGRRETQHGFIHRRHTRGIAGTAGAMASHAMQLIGRLRRQRRARWPARHQGNPGQTPPHTSPVHFTRPHSRYGPSSSGREYSPRYCRSTSCSRWTFPADTAAYRLRCDCRNTGRRNSSRSSRCRK